MEMQIFKNAEFGSIRTAAINGEPFFVGKDVAEVLGYSNSRKALNDHVDEEDKGVTKCDTLGGIQELAIINESGLYSLILSSKMPKARQFKHWVTSEVLPAIRKHGVFAMDEMLENPDAVITALQAYKAEREKRKALEAKNRFLISENEKRQQQITAMEPKVRYCDHVLASPDLVTITVIAKDYGWSAVRMNEYLYAKRIQFKQGETWVLFADYADKGYTGTKTTAFTGTNGEEHSKVHTYWTQKGRLFIYDTLKADGILPMMELQAEMSVQMS